MSLLRALAIAWLLAAAAAQAEEFDGGAFIVHYTVLSTEQLAPKVADAYGIARSPDRALLNVAVLRKVRGTLGVPMAATVQVTATNLVGQYKPIAMRRVDEPPAIYYLGELTVADRETVRFELSVLPEGERSPVRLRLLQQFFTR